MDGSVTRGRKLERNPAQQTTETGDNWGGSGNVGRGAHGL